MKAAERPRERSERDWFGGRQTGASGRSSDPFGGSDDRFHASPQGTGTTNEQFLMDNADVPQRERPARPASGRRESWRFDSDRYDRARQTPAPYERSAPESTSEPAPLPPEETPREETREKDAQTESADKDDASSAGETAAGDQQKADDQQTSAEDNRDGDTASPKPVPVNVQVQAPPRTPQPVTAPEQKTDESPWTTAALYLSAALGGALLAALLLALVGQSFLKRYAQKLNPVFRVELVNAEGQTLSALPVGGAVELPESTPETSAEETSNPTLRVRDFADGDVPLDPGSTMTFADRKAREEEEFRRKEQAVIKHVFEQNVELRQQLSEQQPAAV